MVVYDERQMPDGPDMTAVVAMFEESEVDLKAFEDLFEDFS